MTDITAGDVSVGGPTWRTPTLARLSVARSVFVPVVAVLGVAVAVAEVIDVVAVSDGVVAAVGSVLVIAVVAVFGVRATAGAG